MAFLELSKKGKSVSQYMPNGDEYVFKYGEKTKVPALIAIGYIGATGYKVSFSLEDKEDISNSSSYTKELLKQEFNVKGSDSDLINTMFPKPKPKKITKTIKKTVVPKEIEQTGKVDKANITSEN